jgi:hypothetical protein
VELGVRRTKKGVLALALAFVDHHLYASVNDPGLCTEKIANKAGHVF